MSKKKRYNTGTYKSSKTGKECIYRSGWEAAYFKHLDDDPAVIDWVYEPFTIEYISNQKTRRLRKYTPDILVIREDGRYIEEVKPLNKVHTRTVQKKIIAGQTWCLANNHKFRVITEVELRALGVL